MRVLGKRASALSSNSINWIKGEQEQDRARDMNSKQITTWRKGKKTQSQEIRKLIVVIIIITLLLLDLCRSAFEHIRFYWNILFWMMTWRAFYDVPIRWGLFSPLISRVYCFTSSIKKKNFFPSYVYVLCWMMFFCLFIWCVNNRKWKMSTVRAKKRAREDV